MKAIIFPSYGSPDVLQLVDREIPTPNDDQVLIKVVAASANPLDWHRMRGEPFIARMGEGLRKPQDTRLGADVAGRVEAVGGEIRCASVVGEGTTFFVKLPIEPSASQPPAAPVF